jgi:alpha/beta superfamily hydrolase
LTWVFIPSRGGKMNKKRRQKLNKSFSELHMHFIFANFSKLLLEKGFLEESE